MCERTLSNMNWKFIVPTAVGIVVLIAVIIIATVPEPPRAKPYISPGMKKIIQRLNYTEARILAQLAETVNVTGTDDPVTVNVTETDEDTEKVCPVHSSNPIYADLVNVAYDKDTLGTASYQAHIIGPRHHLTLDCDTTTYYHSIRARYPWWSVDLGTEYLIQAIRILPGQRGRVHWQRFKDIKVSIGMEDPTSRDLNGHTEVGRYVGPYEASEEWVEFNLPMKMSGRYVDISRTTITDDDFIILAEVEVLVDRLDLPFAIPHSDTERRIRTLTSIFLKSSEETKEQIEEVINLLGQLLKSSPTDTDLWIGVRNGTWLNGRVPASDEWQTDKPSHKRGPCGYMESWAGRGRSPTYLLNDHSCAGNASPLCQKHIF